MADFQRTVEDIRLFLQGVDMIVTPAVRELATGYVEHVRAANERLRRCKEFLNQHLRSEAIHVAESPPDLLEVVAVLDFPELPEWQEFCLGNQLPPPPPLLLLVAEDLNLAYADLEPMKEKLIQLRRLALVRGPLGIRLKVMRELADLDLDADYWQQDIAAFEVARHKEIEKQLKSPSIANDLPTLQSLVNELETSAWIQPPKPALLQRAKKLAHGIVRESSINQLDELLPKLLQAMYSGNTAAVEQMQGDWVVAAREAKLPPDDPLHKQATEVFRWLQDEKQRAANDAAYQQALSRFNREMDNGEEADVEELDRLRHAAWAFGRGVPQEIEDRYSATLEKIEDAIKRQKWMMVAKIAACILFVVGFFAVLILLAIGHSKKKEEVSTSPQRLPQVVLASPHKS